MKFTAQVVNHEIGVVIMCFQIGENGLLFLLLIFCSINSKSLLGCFLEGEQVLGEFYFRGRGVLSQQKRGVAALQMKRSQTPNNAVLNSGKKAFFHSIGEALPF